MSDDPTNVCHLSQAEVRLVLAQLQGSDALVAGLLYGSGLRLLEAMLLRIKNVDLLRGRFDVRDAKGGKDRVMVLPAFLIEAPGVGADWVRGPPAR